MSRNRHGDVDDFDACYLPDDRIVFASTASFHAVPCWHGKERACSIYMMNADGTGVRQLCFDQDLDLHPAVLPTGQVIYSRWDYAGTMHIYLRPLMVMNPDGTGQRAVYGSNSYWPNALYFPRGIPGAPGKIVAIVAGYHGVPRMGELALLDITKGSYETDGVVQRIPGRGKPVKPIIRDKLVDKSWPKFLHPYPLSDKYFLVSSQLSAKSPWGIYLVDVFDNILPIHISPRFDLFEPIPLRKTPCTHKPPVTPHFSQILPIGDLISCDRPTLAKVTNAMHSARTNRRNCGSRGLFPLMVLSFLRDSYGCFSHSSVHRLSFECAGNSHPFH